MQVEDAEVEDLRLGEIAVDDAEYDRVLIELVETVCGVPETDQHFARFELLALVESIVEIADSGLRLHQEIGQILTLFEYQFPRTQLQKRVVLVQFQDDGEGFTRREVGLELQLQGPHLHLQRIAVQRHIHRSVHEEGNAPVAAHDERGGPHRGVVAGGVPFHLIRDLVLPRIHRFRDFNSELLVHVTDFVLDFRRKEGKEFVLRHQLEIQARDFRYRDLDLASVGPRFAEYGLIRVHRNQRPVEGEGELERVDVAQGLMRRLFLGSAR